MKFDVHRIESVRIKVAQVEAETPEQALAITNNIDFCPILEREVDIPVEKACGLGAHVASLAHHGAEPMSAMVEVADSHGEQGEHHFDFAPGLRRFVPIASAMRALDTVAKAGDSSDGTATNHGQPESAIITVDGVAYTLSQVQTAISASQKLIQVYAASEGSIDWEDLDEVHALATQSMNEDVLKAYEARFDVSDEDDLDQDSSTDGRSERGG